MIVAESVLNLACVGARPIAVVNCLNFGNPEHPEVMWQLSEAIDGMGDACRALHLPVVGGNVSFYNESRGRDIDPTPVVGVVGLIEALDRRPPAADVADGAVLVLLGDEAPASGPDALGGSLWADVVHGHRGGGLPPLDLAAVGALVDLLVALVPTGLLSGAHDVAEGGLACCLGELAARSGVGVTAAGVADHAALLSEALGRVVVATAEEDADAVLAAAAEAGVPARRLGRAGGDRVVVDGLLDVSLAAATAAWAGAIPLALG